MKPYEIKLSDIQRILFGNAPMEFAVEVFIRTIIIYIFFLVIIQLLGKRMSGQLTITEVAVMITLGAIVAPPMQMPERGVIQGIMILLLIYGIQKLITYWGVKNKKVEKITQGTASTLVIDGTLQLKELKATNISRQQVFALLRSKGVLELAEVERLYLEACGVFSLYKFKTPRPGLSVMPPEDDEITKILKIEQNIKACANCGTVVSKEQTGNDCPVCSEMKWQDAVAV